MKFSDIIALAKAGYTPKDVKDLLELTETDPGVKEKEVEDPKPDPKDPEDPEDKKVKDAFEKLIENENKKEGK